VEDDEGGNEGDNPNGLDHPSRCMPEEDHIQEKDRRSDSDTDIRVAKTAHIHTPCRRQIISSTISQEKVSEHDEHTDD
jgi:hypothetical protein